MTNLKTLFVSALLSTFAAGSFAEAPAFNLGESAFPAFMTKSAGAKAKANVNRQKSARPAKSNGKARRAASKKNKTQDSSKSNSKGPGLEAY